MELTPALIAKAQTELHETDTTKAQSLQEFRDWIAQHDYFADCRKGELELLESDDDSI